ncbi:MAG: vitamin B12-dependent ribonucleotide reductase [Kiritimatiellia bacterium]|nr:vitamin B12-dependent ribonucleotide reductase [Kiritimatiellia bacterium]
MLDVREPIDVKSDGSAARPRTGKGRVPRKTTDKKTGQQKGGLKVRCLLTKKGENPFDKIEWERRRASISGDSGNVIFAQDDVEVPALWSMLATNVVASKYFYGGVGTDDREFSARQLVHRVARTISDWGLSGGYFATPDDAENFYNELCHACINQYGAFNSPVWFNVGLFQVYGHSSSNRSSYVWSEEEGRIVLTNDTYRDPQASACFIQSVEDSMEDIMRLASAEAMLFKYGSGTGSDLSTLRSTREKLSGGGTPSGPISFMRVFDQVAAVIKSGGKTRRAAKMQSLKVWHPDILDFINCKAREEKKAWALIEQGYDGSFNGEAYDSVMFQNANLSVRVTDEFMDCVERDREWQTHDVKSGEPADTLKARDVMQQISDNAHLCGDPGLQYDTTINRWHTCPNSAPINASNPCSEYMFIDDSACNLASVNLMHFVDDEGDVDIDKFKHVVRLFIIAQDILVDSASYPTERVALNSHRFRPLGLGYANLGALIMREGMPYDSEEGRAFASMITALLTGEAYKTSQELAAVKGAFEDYETNADCMLNVMKMHRDSLDGVSSAVAPAALREAACNAWDDVVEGASEHGFRNSQVTVLAPTGTIGFMMDCDTTGVEPDIALVKYKQLAGGGTMKIVNRTIDPALRRLGYSNDDVEAIVAHVDESDTIETAPHLKAEHMEVFDCAFKPVNGTRSISYKAHLKMMAAVQPFLSGAISKTVNLPNEATADDIMQTYIDGWKLGLKAVAVYRDGSKRIQPVRTSQGDGPLSEVVGKDFEAKMAEARRAPFRRRMPATRQSITHKFEVAGHEGYLTVGTYEDGAPGEVFITMAKEGSTVGGTMDAFGTAISLCLQYGVPVRELCQKFAHSRFEPSGFTKNPDIPIAKSIVDYIFRWLDATFPGGATPKVAAQPAPAQSATEEAAVAVAQPEQELPGADRVDAQFKHFMEDAPVCDQCGSITVRNGACYRCYNCGNSMGCS